MRLRASICTVLALLALSAPAWAAQVQVCHIPPGNPANFHTITINDNALQAHLGHGDLAGTCGQNCQALCDDGNPCTQDVDPTGADCVCLSQHPPVDCNDSNLCTVDSCNPATGCETTPKVCLDGALCTVDTCDPLTGNCVFPAVACDAGQTCNPANGTCEGGGACDPNPCQNGGLCLASGSGYSCACASGWEGTNCETDIDECTAFPGICTGCTYCINGDGGYSCPPDWTCY
jgi:hypothetical protein